MIGKYIKVFDNHSEYEDYITGSSKVLPNISYCKDYNDVHYNGYYHPLVAVFNVPDISTPTFIGGRQGQVKELVIDGVKQQSIEAEYQFVTIGQHTVEYILTKPKTIDEQFFADCTYLYSVTIPHSVTSIGKWAFCHCGLTSVTIPDSVTSIGDEAFEDCANLSSITIPASVTSIGRYAFMGNNLGSIVVEQGNTVYDSRNNCNAIVETATNTLLFGCQSTQIQQTPIIADYAFIGCTGEFDIQIPNGVTTVGKGAFSDCAESGVITIGNTVTSIGDEAFSGCESVQNIFIEATTPPTLGVAAFANTNNAPIYVPSASVSTYQSASGWSEYASRIQADV